MTAERAYTEHEIEAMKRNIEAQVDEYERAVEDYARWLAEWQAQHPKGFRCTRRAS